MLTNSSASPALKEILERKAAVRPNRFFGEAYVASHKPHQEGWYCPFKWLTSPAWCKEDADDETHASEFKLALSRHFPRLSEFQERVAAFVRTSNVEKPAGPDLWLVAEGEHHFLEVLPGDYVKPHQLAGLALIAKCLPSEAPFSVGIVSLDSSAGGFEYFVNEIRRHNIQMEPTRVSS